MKLKIDSYEVEIKARNLNTQKEKMNQEDAMSFLVQLSLWAFEASESYRRDGYNALEKSAMNASKEIHEVLEEEGYFDKYR